MRESGRKPSNSRVVQLAQDLIEPSVELGPLDREDLREICCELIELRAKQPKVNETADLVEAVA